jgi:hypothetical protein
VYARALCQAKKRDRDLVYLSILVRLPGPSPRLRVAVRGSVSLSGARGPRCLLHGAHLHPAVF